MSRLAGFAGLFTRPTRARALFLVVGAVLAPSSRPGVKQTQDHSGAAYAGSRPAK
jgi:hypothetical protein